MKQATPRLTPVDLVKPGDVIITSDVIRSGRTDPLYALSSQTWLVIWNFVEKSVAWDDFNKWRDVGLLELETGEIDNRIWLDKFLVKLVI